MSTANSKPPMLESHTRQSYIETIKQWIAFLCEFWSLKQNMLSKMKGLQLLQYNIKKKEKD